jgi:hypothetical protein
MADLGTDLDSFYKLRDALAPLAEGRGIDTAAPRDLWIVINGVEYKLEMSRSIAPINMQPPTAAKH